MTDEKVRGVYTLLFWLSNEISVFYHSAETQYHNHDDLPCPLINGGKTKQKTERNGCRRCHGKEARNQAIMSMFGSFQAGSYPLA